MLRLLKGLFASAPQQRHRTQEDIDAEIVARLRAKGVRIGVGCRIYANEFSTEPWLVTIGDHVGISGGVKFLTHDGSALLIRDVRPRAQRLGTITVGNHVFIGENAIILLGTRIGDHCIIGPGAVVRGDIAENSFVFGNPGVIIGRASLYLERLKLHTDTIDSYGLAETERRHLIESHFEVKRGYD